MEPLILIGIIALAIPFVVPIVSLVLAWSMRRRVAELEGLVARQGTTIGELNARVARLAREAQGTAAAPATTPPLDDARGRPAVVADLARATPAPSPAERAEPRPAPAPATETPKPVERPWPDLPPRPVPPPAAETPKPVERPWPDLPPPAPAPAKAAPPPPIAPRVPPSVAPSAPSPPPAQSAPASPPVRPPSPPPAGARGKPAGGGFDWESLVGVQLFSAIAGIALLIAAVFFLRYSVEHGWLQPPVRAAIGLIVGVSLLVASELKA